MLTMVGKLLNEVEVLQEGIEDHKRENGLEWKQICSYVDMGCMYVVSDFTVSESECVWYLELGSSEGTGSEGASQTTIVGWSWLCWEF